MNSCSTRLFPFFLDLPNVNILLAAVVLHAMTEWNCKYTFRKFHRKIIQIERGTSHCRSARPIINGLMRLQMFFSSICFVLFLLVLCSQTSRHKLEMFVLMCPTAQNGSNSGTKWEISNAMLTVYSICIGCFREFCVWIIDDEVWCLENQNLAAHNWTIQSEFNICVQ